jgi:hypothetical protein
LQVVLKGNGIKGVLAGVLGGYSLGTHGVLTGVLLQVVLKGNGIKESDGSEREPMKYKRDCNCEAECCPQCRYGALPARAGRIIRCSAVGSRFIHPHRHSAPPCSVVLKLDVRCEEKEYRWRHGVVLATLRAVALQRYNPSVATLQVVWRRRDS